MKKITDCHSEVSLEPGNNKPILESIEHALLNKNVEQFGFFKFNDSFSDYEFVACKNLNSFNPHFFSSNDHNFYKNYLDKKIISLFHTHIIEPPEPSDLDKEISKSIGIPSFIFSVKSQRSFLFYPDSYQPKPLSRRIFIPYFQDCITFVKDFYFIELNINLSNSINNWARRLNDSNKVLLNLIKENFYSINLNEISHGDLIVFKPTDFSFFHLAVCFNGSHYWHHPAGMYPSKQLLNKLDRNKVYKVYRYKDL